MQFSRLYLLLMLTAGLLLAGLAARQFGILLLAAPLLVYLAAAAWLSPGQVQVALARRVRVFLPSGVEQAAPLERAERVVPGGSRVSITVTADNHGPSLGEVILRDERWTHIASLGRHETAEWEYSFIPRRGRRDFKPIRLQASDPFGLFPHTFTLPVETDGHLEASLLALPGSQPLRRVPVRPPMLRGYAGPVAARAPGSGTDFFGLREYHPGDPQQRLNWRVSSKFEQALFTNQYEGERYADIGLILDARQSRNLAGSPDDLFEHSLLAAASLGEAFIRDGHRVSLLVYGFTMQRLLPGAGRLQIERIQRMLAVARPVHNFALDNLRYLPTRLFPPRSQIVFISPLGIEDAAPLARFRMMGYDVLVISPDPISFEASHGPDQPADEWGDRPGSDPASETATERQAVRLARLERLVLLRQLERLGVWTVDWRVDQPLAAALRLGLAPVNQGGRWRWLPG